MRTSYSIALVALLSLFVTALALTGCKTESSAGLATSDIRATMYVGVTDNDPQSLPGVSFADAGAGEGGDGGGAPDTGSFISAELYKDDALFDVVSLAPGDNLYVATNLNPTDPLKSTDISGFYDTGDMDLSKLTDATFILTRASGAGAPNSKVTVPPAIVLTAPAQSAMVPVGTSGKISFTWSNPSAGSKVYAYMHECNAFTASASNQDISVPDNGSFDIQWANVPGGIPTTPTCYLARVIRFNKGTPDPAWHANSVVEADRDFWVSFTVTP